MTAPVHVAYPINEIGKDYFSGDVHGEFPALISALRDVGFNIHRDRLFLVGDLGDRGPYSKDMLYFIDAPWCKSVRGNHDQGLIDYHRAADKDNYLHMGRKFSTKRVHETGGSWYANMSHGDREAYCEALESLPLAITVSTRLGDVGVVHAECNHPYWPSFVDALERGDEAAIHSAMLSRDRFEQGKWDNIAGVRAVVVGHTTVKAPAVLGNVHYIDTGSCYKDHTLTILSAETLKPMPLRPERVESPHVLKGGITTRVSHRTT